MDHKLKGITRRSFSNRYKSNERKAATLEDARVLRAIEKQNEQKLLREKSLARRRAMGTPDVKSISGKSTTKKYSKEELRELGKLQYQNMLKWKDQRKLLVEREKRRRKPSFKAGVFKPEPGKYLVATDEEAKEAKVTPWKFCPSSSLKKSVQKNSVLASSRKNSDAVKLLRFHSGATPLAHTKPVPESSVNKHSRVSRSFRPPPMLGVMGVSPLPATPSYDPKVTRRFSVTKKREASFAPRDFQFQAPRGIKLYNLKKNVPGETEDSPKTEEEQKKVEKRLEEEVKEVEKVEEIDGEKGGWLVEELNEDVMKKEREEEEEEEVEEEEKESKETEGMDGESSEVEEKAMKENSSEGESPPPSSPEDLLHLKAHAGATPGPTLRKRTYVTPPLAKLRPRTPCSRSTRRSRSAHCDHVWDMDAVAASRTPKSTKKRGRKSVVKPEAKVESEPESESEFVVKPEVESELASSRLILQTPTIRMLKEQERSQSPFKTPLSSVSAGSKVAPSPFVSKSRGSSGSAKGRKRKDVFSNDLEMMFSNLPLDGSLSLPDLFEEEPCAPVQEGASPQLERAFCPTSGEGEALPKLDLTPLLLATDSGESVSSPVTSVWSPDVSELENSPFTALQDTHQAKVAEKTSPAKAERKPLGEISPALRTANFQTSKRRGSRRTSSVSFLVEEDPQGGGKTSTKSFPVTPVRRSARFSGVFADIKEDLPLCPSAEEDLIKFESPQTSRATWRRSGKPRVSLLPGLDPCQETEETENRPLEEGEDLISWDSPVPPTPASSKKAKHKSYIPTPVRRSKRLSTSQI